MNQYMQPKKILYSQIDICLWLSIEMKDWTSNCWQTSIPQPLMIYPYLNSKLRHLTQV